MNDTTKPALSEPAAKPLTEEEQKQAELENQRRQALEGYPPANASWAGDEFLQHRLPNCS